MESSSQAPWSSVSGEQEERELKDGLLRLAAVAAERRPRTPGERTSPARERAAQRGRTPPGSALGRQARLADASHASQDGGPAAARSSPLLARARAPPPRRCPAVAPPPPSGGGLRTATGTPSWENSCGPAHMLGTFAEREGALTGTQGPRYARSRGTAASSLGFHLNVTPETMQRLQANIGSVLFDISLSSLFSSTTSDWARETKYKMNKRDYIKVKKHPLHRKGNHPQNQNTT
nr:PREDICTED: uncharacterized protein LOC103545420 isoform X1 [Equus przewalskii]